MNRSIERDIDHVKGNLENLLASLSEEIESMENTIEEQAAEIEDLKEKLKEYE